MKFSIIIPTYNRAHLIGKTIQSVLDQSYNEFEIIIVDDGSTDNTSEIVKQFDDDRLFYYKKINAERGVARNFGIKRAKGNYITFLDSDDLLYPNHFEKASRFINQNNPNVFHQGYEIKDYKGKLLFKSKEHSQNINKLLLQGNLLSCMGVFIKRDILIEINFSENRLLSGSEDWLLWLKLSARYPILYSKCITACMINHEDRSVLQFDEKSQRNRLNYLIGELKSDMIFMAKNKHAISKIHASKLSYIALHAVLVGKNKTALKYFIEAINYNWKEIFRRRTFAIVKHFLFSVSY